MQQLIYILFALDESRRYLEDGRMERLRLAIVLLDNAIEMQLDRRIKSDLSSEEMRETLRQRILNGPQESLPEALREIVEWEPLTKKEKLSIDRFFGEKLKYLSQRSKQLDPRLVEPISYLHGYRNEAYHKSVIRPATIRTAGALMLEINCHLLTNIPVSAGCFASDEDYSWIQERFNLRPIDLFMNKECLADIVDSIRGNVVSSKRDVIMSLMEHLESRFDEIYESLDYIVENTKFSDREEALLHIQYYQARRNSLSDSKLSSVKDFRPRHTLSTIEEFIKCSRTIEELVDNLDAFHRFSTIERALEPVEQLVNAAYIEVEHMIEQEVDLARGK